MARKPIVRNAVIEYHDDGTVVLDMPSEPRWPVRAEIQQLGGEPTGGGPHRFALPAADADLLHDLIDRAYPHWVLTTLDLRRTDEQDTAAPA